MKAINYTLTPTVRDVLERVSITGTLLKLPEQLDRKLYVDVNKALELLGGSWNRKAGAHVFTEDPRDVVADALATGTILDFKKTFQFYETPHDVAEQMCDLAELQVGMTVLEPSAGKGAIVRVLNARGLFPAVYEIASTNRNALVELQLCGLIGSDFLNPGTIAPVNVDRVIGNPPFRLQQDIAHVTRMVEVCKPGGRVVSIMSPAWRFRDSKQAKTFRELAKACLYTWEALPPDTFKESGTSVHTGIIVLNKPEV